MDTQFNLRKFKSSAHAFNDPLTQTKEGHSSEDVA